MQRSLHSETLPGRVFGSDFTNGNVVTTAGDSAQADTGNELEVNERDNESDAANIPESTANALATNGVVHVTGRVLLHK